MYAYVLWYYSHGIVFIILMTYCCEVFIFDHAAFTVATSFLVSVLLSAVSSFLSGRAFHTPVSRGDQVLNK